MENTNKLIRKNIPSYLKWAISIIISAFVANYLLPSLFNWKPLVLPDGMIPSLIITLGLILISIIISLFKSVTALSQQLSLVEDKKPNAYVVNQTKKKKLPDYIDLKTENSEKIEYSIKVVRCFYPDDKPGLDKFLEVIRIKNVVCEECKADIKREFINSIRPGTYFTCSNNKCKNHKQLIFDDYHMKNFLDQFLALAKSEIRRDFGKHWDLYLDQYKSLTDGKYKEYDEPIGFYNATQYY